MLLLESDFFNSGLFNWVILPLGIFFIRTCDVSLATLRNIFIAKGLRHIVPFMSFCEVLIWLVAVTQIMKNLNNILCYVGFAGGFGMGTYVGMIIERRLALGMQVLRIITNQDPSQLVVRLKEENMGVTVVDGHGTKGPVKILFIIIKRRDLGKVCQCINHHIPQVFYTIEDIRTVQQGVFPGALGCETNKFSSLRRLFMSSK